MGELACSHWGGERGLQAWEEGEPQGEWGHPPRLALATQGEMREEQGRDGALGFQAAPDTQFSSWVP